MSDTDDTLRARFRELGAQRDAIMAKSMPLRERRDKLVREARAKEDELNARIKAEEAGLFDIVQEIGRISRALRPAGSLISNTGEAA